MTDRPGGRIGPVTSSTAAQPTLTAVPDVPTVPAWAVGLPGTRLASARVADAARLASAELSAAVAVAYADVLSRSDHPVRFWNLIPGINGAVDGGQSRYMAFNAGRLAAFDRQPAARAATASGVGHAGRDLWVHCLSSPTPGTPIDNPRQVQPHRYSARYGHRPPCFARATRLSTDVLLIGGTASIRGEDTVHADLANQTAETLTNLSAVLAAAGNNFELAAVRVYHLPSVAAADLRPLLPPLWRVELVTADLCRPELLVEIEALARGRE